MATKALALPPPGAEVLAPSCSIKERTEPLTRGPPLVAPILYLQNKIQYALQHASWGDIQKTAEVSVNCFGLRLPPQPTCVFEWPLANGPTMTKLTSCHSMSSLTPSSKTKFNVIEIQSLTIHRGLPPNMHHYWTSKEPNQPPNPHTKHLVLYHHHEPGTALTHKGPRRGSTVVQVRPGHCAYKQLKGDPIIQTDAYPLLLSCSSLNYLVLWFERPQRVES